MSCKTPIGGLIVAMVTPMTRDEALDLNAVPALVNALVTGGADGLFVSGTAGENWALTEKEKEALFAASVEAAAGRVPVIAGTGAETTGEALRVTAAAERAGCDAVSVVTPYYIRPSQEELYAHFRRVADACKLPAMVYNIPGFTGVNVDAPTMARLMKAGVLGAKDSSGNEENLMGYIDAAGPDNCILVGSDPLILKGLRRGAKGCISAPSNAGLPLIARLFAAHRAGDAVLADQLQAQWSKALQVLRAGTFPVAVKAATHALVVPVGPCRGPIAPLPPEDLARVVKELSALLS